MNENLRKMILGEKMPSKDDPKYRETYERDVEAGRKFAKRTRLDRLVGHVQKFADRHSGLFLGIVLAIVVGCFVINAYHFTKAYQLRKAQTESARTPEESIREALDNAHTMIPIQESEEDGTVQEN
jgi:Cation transport ATPase